MNPEYGRTIGDAIASLGGDVVVICMVALMFAFLLAEGAEGSEEEDESEAYRCGHCPSNIPVRAIRKRGR